MDMKWLVPLLAFALLASSALGCLGETEPELAQRYGKQTKTGTSKLPGVTIRGYQFKGFAVVVGMLNDRSAFEMYSKRDQSKLSTTEVGALMNANAGGGTWTVVADPAFEGTKWVLSDGSVSAEWGNNGTALTVMTKAGADLMKTDTPKKK
jgi:hypothetical protein